VTGVTVRLAGTGSRQSILRPVIQSPVAHPIGALSSAGMGAAAGMASGLAKKGARGGKRLGSTASSKLGSGDGAFVGGVAGGFLSDDESQSFSSDTGMDDSIADAPEPVSAVGATDDTPDSFERVDRPGGPTQADRAPDPAVDDWDTYVAKAGGDEAVAHEFMQQDRQLVAQQRELDQLRGEIQDGDNQFLTAAAGDMAKTIGGEAIKWGAGGFALSGGNFLIGAGGLMAGAGYGALKGGALGVLGKTTETVVQKHESTGSLRKSFSETGDLIESEGKKHYRGARDDLGSALDWGKDKMPFVGGEGGMDGSDDVKW